MTTREQFTLAVAIHQNLEWVKSTDLLGDILEFVNQNNDDTLSVDENVRLITERYAAKRHSEAIKAAKSFNKLIAET